MHDDCSCCRGMAALIASGILDTLETSADRDAAGGTDRVAATETGSDTRTETGTEPGAEPGFGLGGSLTAGAPAATAGS